MTVDIKHVLSKIKEQHDYDLPKPKDWPVNLYDENIKKAEEESKKKNPNFIIKSVLTGMGVDVKAIQDPMRWGFKAAVDSRDQQILQYLKDKGIDLENL